MNAMYRVSILILCFLIFTDIAETSAQTDIPGEQAAGRWDITIQTPQGTRPAWLEIEKSGSQALVGRFVGPAGSARPISEIHFDKNSNTYRFTIPPQWTQPEANPQFEFTLNGEILTGWTTGMKGERLKWSARRAPDLKREAQPVWGEPVPLIDEDLSHWIIPENNQFVVSNGVLKNREKGGNLVTRQKFKDFKLHVEFRYPEESNSGIYLRGRYEVQIADNYGMEPESHLIGGVYGFIDPTENAAKKAGKWQAYDITLAGRMVTVELNGIKVINNRPIPGITGGALDSKEGEPGPIMLQGDHGAVEFRNIIITPALN